MKMMQMAALLWLATASTPQKNTTKNSYLMRLISSVSVLLLIITEWRRQIQMEFWNLCGVGMSVSLIDAGGRGSFWVENVFQRVCHGHGEAALNSFTFMLQMSFTAWQQSKHYDLGPRDGSSIWTTVSAYHWRISKRQLLKLQKKHALPSIQIIQQECKTKKLSCQLAMKLDYLLDSPETSTAAPGQSQKKKSYMHVVWIRLWRFAGKLSCLCACADQKGLSSG